MAITNVHHIQRYHWFVILGVDILHTSNHATRSIRNKGGTNVIRFHKFLRKEVKRNYYFYYSVVTFSTSLYVSFEERILVFSYSLLLNQTIFYLFNLYKHESDRRNSNCPTFSEMPLILAGLHFYCPQQALGHLLVRCELPRLLKPLDGTASQK